MEHFRITLTYNLRGKEDDATEFISREYADHVLNSISALGFDVTPVEVTGPPEVIIDDILDSKPDLIFNLAEGMDSKGREAYFPAIFEILDIPYTGGGPAIMYINLDKRLTLKLLEVNGIKVPKGILITSREDEIPDDLRFPAFIKPNYEGSSLGIGEDSIVNSREEAAERIDELIDDFPLGIDVEEFIEGRELTVPMLEEFPGRLLEIVEYRKKKEKHNIMDKEVKKASDKEEVLDIICPAQLESKTRKSVLEMSSKTFEIMRTSDLGRVDIRLAEDGTPYLIEVTALPGLKPASPMVTAAKARGLSYNGLIERIIRSARKRCLRYGDSQGGSEG